MDLITNAQLLARIHNQILHKSTGTAKQFAVKLEISKRTLYRRIKDLKEMGAEVVFDRIRMSYVYKNEVEIKFLLKIQD